MQRYAQRQDHFTVADPETELRKNSCLYECQIILGDDNGSNKDPGESIRGRASSRELPGGLIKHV